MELQFEHRQSAHCENGVASNLLHFYGMEISEPMVFGIGAGLFFFYFPLLKVNQAPAISFRTMPGYIFSKAAKRLGFKVKRQKFSSPEKAQRVLDENLSKGNPVGLQVGVYNLTYFPDAYRFHFNGHNLCVYGKKDNTYLISDPVMPSVTTLSQEELESIRFAKGTLAPRGHLYYPTHIPKQVQWENAIKSAIKEVCQAMLSPLPIIGVKAIKRVSRHIPKWAEKKGTKITNHYLAQLIRMQEEIGTGGGGFRFIYAAFLQEAAEILQNKKLRELSLELTNIGDMWREFAVNIARVCKNRSNTPDVYNVLSKELAIIAQKEELFFRKLKKSV